MSRSKRIRWLAALFLGLVLPGCATVAPPEQNVGEAGTTCMTAAPCHDLDISGSACVAPERLYRGSQPDAAAFRRLEAAGFTTIVDLCLGHDERSEVEALEMTAVRIEMCAGLFCSRAPSDDDVKRFLDLVTGSANEKIFFHCAHGRDRTGTMCAVYRMEVDGWTPEAAMREMRLFGFSGYYRTLDEYVRNYKIRGLWKRPSPLGAPSTAPTGSF